MSNTGPTACPCPPCLTARSLDLAYVRQPCELADTEPSGPAPLVATTRSGSPYLTDAGVDLLSAELGIAHDGIVDPARIMHGLGVDVSHEDLRANILVEARSYYRECAECPECNGEDGCSCEDEGIDVDYPVPRLRDGERIVCARCLTEAPLDLHRCAECSQQFRAVPVRRVARVVPTTVCRDEIARMARAMRVYLDGDRGPTHAALELARNVATVLSTPGEAIAVRDALRLMLDHRLRNGWARCGDVESCVEVGAQAWDRARAETEGRVAA